MFSGMRYLFKCHKKVKRSVLIWCFFSIGWVKRRMGKIVAVGIVIVIVFLRENLRKDTNSNSTKTVKN